jgi:D-amino-acid dehydrogenase
MQILVIGAGVVGLSTAYYLQADGHQVTVVDGHAGVGLAASYANGGQLSYSYVAPLAGPGVLGKLPSWLMHGDSPLRFKPTLDLEQWRWCMRFVLACNARQSDLTTRHLLALSMYSRTLMHEFVERESDLQFDYGKTGKLVVYRDQASFDAARRLLDYQRTLGCEQQALSADECVKVEPALGRMAHDLTGGIHTPSEDSADCYRFCVSLEQRLQQAGTRFRFSTSITGFKQSDDGCMIAAAGNETLHADHIVLASGVSNPALLRPLGIRVPIYPLQGYSLTLPITDDRAAPTTSVTDFQRKVVYARLGNRLRVAGMADLTGRKPAFEARRVATLRAEAEAAFPNAGHYESAQPWSGLRPATPTGIPVLGPTRYRNLWLNLGQGALGFTLALGSGKLVADEIARRARHPDLHGFLGCGDRM